MRRGQSGRLYRSGSRLRKNDLDDQSNHEKIPVHTNVDGDFIFEWNLFASRVTWSARSGLIKLSTLHWRMLHGRNGAVPVQICASADPSSSAARLTSPVTRTGWEYAAHPVFQGILDGYLMMDAIGALVFGIVLTTVRALWRLPMWAAAICF